MDAKTTHILLIGGAGYIGAEMSKDLLKLNYKVRVLDVLLYKNKQAITPSLKSKNFSFINGDFRDEKKLLKALKGISDVVILAGLVGDPITKKYPKLSNEINYIELIASNSLFSTTTIELEFSNFYDIVNDNDIPVVLGGEISTTGLDTTFSDTLASKYLGVPGEPDSVMKSISIGMKIQIDEVIDGPIALGDTYALSVSKLLMSKIKLAYLTAISYDMGFDTPSSNIAGMPQGGIGLQFYDVQLILDIYTQIGIPIQLDMVLNGIKGTDSVITLIDPVLNVPNINTSGDSVRTVITLNREGQRVE